MLHTLEKGEISNKFLYRNISLFRIHSGLNVDADPVPDPDSQHLKT